MRRDGTRAAAIAIITVGRGGARIGVGFARAWNGETVALRVRQILETGVADQNQQTAAQSPHDRIGRRQRAQRVDLAMQRFRPARAGDELAGCHRGALIIVGFARSRRVTEILDIRTVGLVRVELEGHVRIESKFTGKSRRIANDRDGCIEACSEHLNIFRILNDQILVVPGRKSKYRLCERNGAARIVRLSWNGARAARAGQRAGHSRIAENLKRLACCRWNACREGTEWQLAVKVHEVGRKLRAPVQPVSVVAQREAVLALIARLLIGTAGNEGCRCVALTVPEVENFATRQRITATGRSRIAR